MEGGTREGLELLYRTRFRAFLRVAAGIVGERHAADAVHDGFVRALRHRDRLREARSLEAWVWRTVINAAHDARRADRDALLGEPPTAPSTNGHPPSGDERVRAMIAALPPRQRLAIFLRYYADLDYGAIAEILEVSPGTVASTLHKAHAAIRRHVQEAAR
jgi:RNA polymerase sigma factor (sigma-70 family)